MHDDAIPFLIRIWIVVDEVVGAVKRIGVLVTPGLDVGPHHLAAKDHCLIIGPPALRAGRPESEPMTSSV